MVKLMIDQKAVEVPEGSTIMEAAENAGIPIPRLCFLKDINEIGACRVCVVEIEGREQFLFLAQVTQLLLCCERIISTVFLRFLRTLGLLV